MIAATSNVILSVVQVGKDVALPPEARVWPQVELVLKDCAIIAHYHNKPVVGGHGRQPAHKT